MYNAINAINAKMLYPRPPLYNQRSLSQSLLLVADSSTFDVFCPVAVLCTFVVIEWLFCVPLGYAHEEVSRRGPHWSLALQG